MGPASLLQGKQRERVRVASPGEEAQPGGGRERQKARGQPAAAVAAAASGRMTGLKLNSRRRLPGGTSPWRTEHGRSGVGVV